MIQVSRFSKSYGLRAVVSNIGFSIAKAGFHKARNKRQRSLETLEKVHLSDRANSLIGIHRFRNGDFMINFIDWAERRRSITPDT